MQKVTIVMLQLIVQNVFYNLKMACLKEFRNIGKCREQSDTTKVFTRDTPVKSIRVFTFKARVRWEAV